jgi:hypothetical protein
MQASELIDKLVCRRAYFLVLGVAFEFHEDKSVVNNWRARRFAYFNEYEMRSHKSISAGKGARRTSESARDANGFD